MQSCSSKLRLLLAREERTESCTMLRLAFRSAGHIANHETPRGLTRTLTLLSHPFTENSRPCSFLYSFSATWLPSALPSNWHPEVRASPLADQGKMSHVPARFILAEHLSTLVLGRDPFHWLTEGLPVHVASSPAGRGVFSCRQLAAGELIHWAAPVVAHPKLECTKKVCYACLGPLPIRQPEDIFDFTPKKKELVERGVEDLGEKEESEGEREGDGLHAHFCSTECRQVAWEQFYRVESAADWSCLNSHCQIGGLKFLLLARRFACMVLSKSISSNALRPLCFLEIKGKFPEQWVDEHRLLVEALKGSKQFPSSELEFLSIEWYGFFVARCHLNAFKIAISPPLIGQSLLEATIAAVEGEGDIGTAVYMLPSLYNHDCDPNVDIMWPNNDSSAQLTARRNIEAGEELRITYLDASMGRRARQSFLAEAYGFVCDCPRCQDEATS